MKSLNKICTLVIATLLTIPVMAQDWYSDRMEIPFVDCTLPSGAPMKFSQLGPFANYGITVGSNDPSYLLSVFGTELEIVNGELGNVEELTLFTLHSGVAGTTAVLSVEWINRYETEVTIELWSDGHQILNETCQGSNVYVSKPSLR